MKNSLLFVCLLLFAQGLIAQIKIAPHEIDLVAQSDWKGSYTYLDFPTGKKKTIPAELKAEKLNDRSIEMNFIFPYETRNNKYSDKLKIGKDLGSIEGNPIVLKDLTDDGQIRIVTLSKEKYFGQNAEIYYSYILGPNKLQIRKEVQFEGKTELLLAEGYEFLRNQY